MIRGYFATIGTRRRPVIDAVFQFPTISNHTFQVRLLVDTGADRTVLAPLDANRLGRELDIEITSLASGVPSRGVGGTWNTRTIETVLTLDTVSIPLTLSILEPPPGQASAIPSLLGRDVLSRFALFMEERTSRVLLLEPHEADVLDLPSQSHSRLLLCPFRSCLHHEGRTLESQPQSAGQTGHSATSPLRYWSRSSSYRSAARPVTVAAPL
jgi:hypothetical protein